MQWAQMEFSSLAVQLGLSSSGSGSSRIIINWVVEERPGEVELWRGISQC